jgi:hypothetical protein
LATTSTQRAQALELLGARSIMRLKDFAAQGIGPEALSRLVREGVVVRPEIPATGCPVIVNTSFNIRGEPIVGSPEDVSRGFMGTDIEMLAVGNCYLRKENHHQQKRANYKDLFALD